MTKTILQSRTNLDSSNNIELHTTIEPSLINHRLYPMIARITPNQTSNCHRQQRQRLRKTMQKNMKKPLTAVELRQRQMDREEMQSLLAKLKQLVPGIPKNRRLTKLEIIQHVIDYIFDLQTALESHPIASTMAASAMATADFHNNQQHYSEHNSNYNNHNDNHNNCRLQTDTRYGFCPDNSPPTNGQMTCDLYMFNPHHTHPQTNQTLPQRIPGQNRQPLASIVL